MLKFMDHFEFKSVKTIVVGVVMDRNEFLDNIYDKMLLLKKDKEDYYDPDFEKFKRIQER